MKSLIIKRLLFFLIILSLSSVVTEISSVGANSIAYEGIAQPRKAKKAQKKQDAKKKKQKEAIKDGSKEAQKRSYDIQSPDVQARMKQNKKDTAARDKEKRKRNKSGTKKGAKKYK